MAKQHGGEAFIAHPYWSGLVVSDLLRWDGHLGVEVFNTGATPEEIAQDFPVLRLDDIYAVITYYLRHRDEVETYLEQRRAQAAEVRRKIEERVDLPSGYYIRFGGQFEHLERALRGGYSRRSLEVGG